MASAIRFRARSIHLALSCDAAAARGMATDAGASSIGSGTSRKTSGPRRKAALSHGASHSSSRPWSSQVRVSEHPAMSRLVTNSPTSGATAVSPFRSSCRSIDAQAPNNSSYFVPPSPLRMTATRPLASAGRSRKSRSTSTCASSLAVTTGPSETPGSPWIPRPIAISRAGTTKRGSLAPGSVHPR